MIGARAVSRNIAGCMAYARGACAAKRADSADQPPVDIDLIGAISHCRAGQRDVTPREKRIVNADAIPTKALVTAKSLCFPTRSEVGDALVAVIRTGRRCETLRSPGGVVK